MQMIQFQTLLQSLAGNASDAPPPKLRPKIDQLFESRTGPDGQLLHWDELALLRDLADQIDADEPARAWEKIQDIHKCLEKNLRVERQVFRSLAFSLHRCSLPFYDVENNQVASGTAVQIGDTVFLATAAHAIPRRPKSRLVFVGFDESPTNGQASPIIDFGCNAPDEPDVGYIELPLDFVTHSLKKEPIAVERIWPCGAGIERQMVYLFGYPSRRALPTNDSSEGSLLRFQAQCYSYLPVMPRDWEGVERSEERAHQPDPSLHIFLPYLIGEELMRFEGLPVPELPEPPGLSGGGLWTLSESCDHMWTPQKYRLIGIQSRWPRHGRHLQATQIIHWIRLVYSKRRDVQSFIEEVFSQQLTAG